MTELTVRRSAVSSSSSNLAIQIPWTLRCCGSAVIVKSTGLGQDDPCDPGYLGRKGHNDLVNMHAGLKLAQPRAQAITGAVQMQSTGSGTMDQQPAQVSVASLADPEKLGLAAC